MKNSTLVFIALLIIGLMTGLFVETKKQLSKKELLVEALTDSIHTWVDVNGKQTATITAIQDDNTKLFLALKSSDSTIIKLQADVKEALKRGKLKLPGSSMTYVGRETGIGITVPSIIQNGGYFSTVNMDGWITGTIFAKEDSTEVNLKVKDEFSVSLDYEPRKWYSLSAPKPYVEVISKNPYSKTKELRTYQVNTPGEPNLIIGPSVGVGYPGFFLGVSATYPLFKFRL